jgi:hypothetical protein
MLVIDNCPGFGDAVLNAMTGPGPQRVCSCAHYIQGLSIINCPDFSISALKQLVETRRIKSSWSDRNNFYPPAQQIRVLRLSGRVPVVSSEDIDWFKGCGSQFAYNPMQ